MNHLDALFLQESRLIFVAVYRCRDPQRLLSSSSFPRIIKCLNYAVSMQFSFVNGSSATKPSNLWTYSNSNLNSFLSSIAKQLTYSYMDSLSPFFLHLLLMWALYINMSTNNHCFLVVMAQNVKTSLSVDKALPEIGERMEKEVVEQGFRIMYQVDTFSSPTDQTLHSLLSNPWIPCLRQGHLNPLDCMQ